MKSATFSSADRPSPRWSTVLAIFSAAFVALLLPLLTLRVEPKWDALDQFLPAFTYLADALREGRLPLWDPYTNSGYPFHAEPQYLTFNPLAQMLAVLVDSPFIGFVFFWVLHWWWGGIGMIWLARQFGASLAGALSAGLAWALSGFFVGHAQHTSYILFAAWLPWVFALADRAVGRSSFPHALLAGLALGVGSLGGYPGLVLFAPLALTLWLCLRHLPEEQGDPRSLAGRCAWILATMGVIGTLFLVIWSPMLNAFFLEGGGYTERVGQLAPEVANYGHPFSPAAAVSLFYPFATIIGREWMGADISMTNAYLGILTLPLATFWLRKNLTDRRAWLLVFFALFMFWLSLGGEYGLRNLLYHLYPPLRYLRFSAPFRLFWMLPLALAAGLAISRLAHHPEERPMLLKAVLAWLFGALAVAVSFCFLAPLPAEELRPSIPRLFLPGLGVLIAAGGLLWHAGARERGTRLLPVALATLMFVDLSAHLYINSETVWNRGEIIGKLTEHHRRSTAFEGAPPPRWGGRPFGYLNAQQIFKVPLIGGYVTMQSDGFNDLLADSRFAEVLSGPMRFWLSPGAETADSRDRALALLSRTGRGAAVPVFIEEDAGLSRARSVPGSFGRVDIHSYAPERIEMSVHVPGDQPAILASTERWAAGWKLSIDEVSQPVLKTNFFFRGALVPAGSHDLVWEYAPEHLLLLSSLSRFALLAVPVAACILLRWDKRRRCDRGAALR